MDSNRFKELLEELDGNSVKTLAEKNARYSQNGDALHNFRSGAEIAGGTPAQACWGYLTKHLVALRDKVEKNDFSDREDLLEKCQDTINYIRFLWCIANDVKVDVEKTETILTANDLNPLPECKFAKYSPRTGLRYCAGTMDDELCPGYKNCENYRRKGE